MDVFHIQNNMCFYVCFGGGYGYDDNDDDYGTEW